MSTEDLIEALRNEYLDEARQAFNHRVSTWTESPIEALFLAQLLLAGWDSPGEYAWRRMYARMESAWGVTKNGRLLHRPEYTEGDPFVVAQAKVVLEDRCFRLDFALLSDIGKVAIEIDGHDFHERTKAQARKDKSRDRLLSKAGWRVIRFTGSEVYGESLECVDQVLGLHQAMVKERQSIMELARVGQ